MQFFEAEEYHQDYLEKNPSGYCHIDLTLAEEPVIRVSDYPRPPADEIRRTLTDEQYRVTQENATEAPFTNPYDQLFEPGLYVDLVTGEPLSPSGQVRFRQRLAELHATDRRLRGHPSHRHEPGDGPDRGAQPGRDSHLGHVFPDGPADRARAALLHQLRRSALHP